MIELYINIVYTMMAQVAQKQWMRKNYSSSKLHIRVKLNSVKFMSLEEPGEANVGEVNVEGLKLALENSVLKLGSNTERKNRGIFISFLH